MAMCDPVRGLRSRYVGARNAPTLRWDDTRGGVNALALVLRNLTAEGWAFPDAVRGGSVLATLRLLF